MKCNLCARRITGQSKRSAYKRYGVSLHERCRRALGLAVCITRDHTFHTRGLFEFMSGVGVVEYKDIADAIFDSYYDWELAPAGVTEDLFFDTIKCLLAAGPSPPKRYA